MALASANRSTTQSTKELAALRRLNLLNRFRDAGKAESDLAYYAAQLSGFSQDAIDAACTELEREEVDKFKPWPPVQRFQELCRKHTRPVSTEWTLDRYEMAEYFDRFVRERQSFGESRESVMARFPDMAPIWVAWRNQTDAGTIQIPAAWCRTCRGLGLISEYENGVCRRMVSCHCRKAAA